MNTAPIDVPVVIVGGGPAGVTIAMELAYRGVRSVVIERRLRHESPSPRCNTTNARSMEIFRRLGCADNVRNAGLPADFNTDVVYMTHFNGVDLARYERSTRAEVQQGRMHGVASDWPTPEPQHVLSQIYLEPVLRDHARAAYDIDLREGWDFQSFEQSGDAVVVVARNVATGEEQTFRAQYLIGADGGGSAVRRDIGARLEGIPEISNQCSVYFEAPRLKELYDRNPGWMIYCIAERGVVVAIDGEDRWLMHFGAAPGESMADFDTEAAMFKAIGEPFEYKILNEVRWTSRAMVANKYRDERVFLIGDAAHIWIPMGGFGMNAAIADAATLGWMLAGTISGWLNPAILDAYEAERAPIGGLVASQAAKWARELQWMSDPSFDRSALLTDSAAQADFAVRIRASSLSQFECPGMQLGIYYANSPVIEYDGTEPPLFSLVDYPETSWPGVRAPHIVRSETGKPLFDEFGRGFTLLRIGAHPAGGDALVREAAARSVPLAVVAVDEAEAVRKYEGYELVLVRPDGHIGFRSHGEPADACAVWDRVTGCLMPEHTIEVIAAETLPATFAFGESARWRKGKLIFSDMLDNRVVQYDPQTRGLTTLAEVPGGPNGLAILPGGKLLVTSMNDRKILLIRKDGSTEEYADLSALATGQLGDMAADGAGRVYVGDIGSRLLDGEPPAPGRLILVQRDGSAEVVLDNLQFPNGLAVRPDGTTLLLAETMTRRISQSRIDQRTGRLSDTRPALALEGGGCDGMAIDAAGGTWLCIPRANVVERYDRAGRLSARIEFAGSMMPIACALDDDESSLYIVGIEPLSPGSDIFGALQRRETVGRLACAALPPRAQAVASVRLSEPVPA